MCVCLYLYLLDSLGWYNQQKTWEIWAKMYLNAGKRKKNIQNINMKCVSNQQHIGI